MKGPEKMRRKAKMKRPERVTRIRMRRNETSLTTSN
jgi:hypothetical protein